MESPRFGTLVVIIDKARNLPNRKKIGKQDAYAIVRLGHEVQRTPTDKRAGQVPSWNHEIRFQVPKETENILKVSIFNEDSKTPDLIGDCAIDLTDLYKKHEFDSWFDLKYKEKPAGEVYAELTFYYEGPPRPKSKIDGPHIEPSVSMTRGGFTRCLPALPQKLEGIRTPARQNSLPIQGRMSPAHVQEYDPAYALANLSLNAQNSRSPPDASGYVPSPYQSGIKYAETWDGVRPGGQQSIKPGPGDIRRKSISSDTRPRSPHVLDNTRSHSSMSTSHEQRYYDSHGDASQHGYVTARRYSQGGAILPSSVLSTYPGQQHHHLQGVNDQDDVFRLYNSALPPSDVHQGNQSTQFGGHFPQIDHDRDDVHYVEPVLDPRHGSVSEIKNSPRIVSPHPEYAPAYQASHVVARDSYDLAPIHPRQETAPRNPYTQARAPQDEFIPQQAGAVQYARPGVFDTFSRQYHKHAQAQSYSQPRQVRSNQSDLSQTFHQKSASHSAAHPSESSRVYNGQTLGNSRESLPNTSLYNRSQELATGLGNQSIETYAPTPAQYRSQNRPLPPAPGGPPARPAKIPLGLTQEEYNILNGL